MFKTVLFFFLGNHFFQNIGEKRTMTVKISSRPISISRARYHLAASGRKAQLKAGPASPSAGPVLPMAEKAQPMAVSNESPMHCSTKIEMTSRMA